MWVEELQDRCGFTEHAYVTMPTSVAGDLHHRTRLLSVHTRGAFHPAAALLRLLDIDSDHTTLQATPKQQEPSNDAVFAFTTGASETRAAAKGGICPVYGRLPAYNSGLNVALFVPSARSFFKLSPWLATRCSGLPDSYQDVWTWSEDKVVKKQPNHGELALALASTRLRRDPGCLRAQPILTCALVRGTCVDMVSPLQARELGHAIASEWMNPRAVASVPTLCGAPPLPILEYMGTVPIAFPVSIREGSSMLCFSGSNGKWHDVHDKQWIEVAPHATLESLCKEAIKLDKLTGLTNLTDLNRACDDMALLPWHRKCAEAQYARIRKAEEEQLRRESRSSRELEKRPTPKARTRSLWVQCDDCHLWRRLTIAPAAAEKLPDRWTCANNGTAPFNRCSVPEEAWDHGEAFLNWEELDEPYSAENDRWLLTVANKLVDSDQWKMQLKRAVSTTREFAFDYFLRSRTAEELALRVHQLRERRSGLRPSTAEPAIVQEPLNGTHRKPMSMATIRLLGIQEHVRAAQTAEAATPASNENMNENDQLPVEEGPSASESPNADGDNDESSCSETHAETKMSSSDSDDDPPVAKILGHHVYSGAKPGSLYNVYVRLLYADGSRTERKGYEPSEPLCGMLEGPSVLAEYCRTERGKAIIRFVPPDIFRAAAPMSDLELAQGAGIVAAHAKGVAHDANASSLTDETHATNTPSMMRSKTRNETEEDLAAVAEGLNAIDSAATQGEKKQPAVKPTATWVEHQIYACCTDDRFAGAWLCSGGCQRWFHSACCKKQGDASQGGLCPQCFARVVSGSDGETRSTRKRSRPLRAETSC